MCAFCKFLTVWAVYKTSSELATHHLLTTYSWDPVGLRSSKCNVTYELFRVSYVLLSCVGVVLNTSSGKAMAVDRDISLAARAGIPSENGVVCLETSFVYCSLMQ